MIHSINNYENIIGFQLLKKNFLSKLSLLNWIGINCWFVKPRTLMVQFFNSETSNVLISKNLSSLFVRLFYFYFKWPRELLQSCLFHLWYIWCLIQSYHIFVSYDVMIQSCLFLLWFTRIGFCKIIYSKLWNSKVFHYRVLIFLFLIS